MKIEELIESKLKSNKVIFKKAERLIVEIFESLGSIESMETLFKSDNPFANSKFYEYYGSDCMQLKVSEKGQGPDATDKDKNVWELKCLGSNRKQRNMSFSFQKVGDKFEDLEESLFKKVEGKPFKSGKLSGRLLACRKLPLSEGFGFSEMIECDMKDIWESPEDAEIKLLRDKMEKDYDEGTKFSSSVDYENIKKMIENGKIPGKVYNREQIKEKFEKNCPEEKKSLYNKLDELLKLFSDAVYVEEGKLGYKFRKGVNPLNKNDLNEFRASVYTDSLMFGGNGPDAVGVDPVSKKLIFSEFKVLGGAKSARLDWGSVPKKWEDFLKDKVTKKFMWNDKSIRYYVFKRKGQKFTDCYTAEGSVLLGNKEIVKRIKTSYDTIGERKTKKLYLSLSFLTNPLFTNVNLDKVLDISWD